MISRLVDVELKILSMYSVAGEIDGQSVKCLRSRHEDPGLGPQQPSK